MKQTIRYASLLSLILLAMLTVTSCDTDDDLYGNPIVGNWQMVAPLDQFYNEFSFYADGTGSYYVEDDLGPDTYYIEWYTDGPELWVYFPDTMGADSMYFTWRVSGPTLYLYPDGAGTPWVYQWY